MSDIVSSFRDISITSKDDLVDITDLFFETTSKIPYSKIVKSNNFSLLQGTHALELQNPRLDTFSLNQVPYDLHQQLTLSDASAIIACQLKALSSWLDDNVSLPTSLLSSEYISSILAKIKNSQTFQLENSNPFIELVNRHSALLISVVKFVIELAMKSQIYEEEDLNTSTMNLDWFETLDDVQIKSMTTVKNETWIHLKIGLSEDKEKLVSFMQSSFNTLHVLLDLKSIFSWNIPLFKFGDNFEKTFNTQLSKLENVSAQLDIIDLLDLESLTPPEGSFNTNSQLLFDNQAPPKEVQIFKLDWNCCVKNLSSMFSDIVDILNIVKVKNTVELLEWLRYLENKRNNNNDIEINGLHIIARVLLFSWMRNNSSNVSQQLVFNIPNFDFKNLLWRFLLEFTLENTTIDNGIRQGRNTAAIEQIDYYFDNVSLLWKEIVFSPTLNPSRQRQFKCKELKYWNLRQMETGNLEEYFKEIHFYRNNESFPLTLTIIYFKLKSIQEIILKSVELNLYKDVREYLSVYYQLTLISYQIDRQIEKLIGIRKASKTDLFYFTFLRNENNLILQLAIAKCKVFEILTSMGLNNLPKNIVIKTPSTESLLYNLQWKQFNTIDEPQLLRFEDFKKRVVERMNEFNTDSFEKLVAKEITDAVTTFTKALTMCNLLINKLNWFDELKGIKLLEIEKLKDEMMKTKSDIEELIKLHVHKKKIKLIIKKSNRHRYFPGIKIIE